ncbi:MAG: amino acid ABC transporter permease [Alphaproteobacteria bacterium]|nr:amino acid ABC transporter permease [Alphaproteobacteria bacterium]
MTFDVNYIWRNLPLLLEGLQLTVLVSLFGLLLAVPLGLVVALALLRRGRPENLAARAYVQWFRNTPPLIQIYLVYFGFPMIGLSWNPLATGVVGLAIYHGAFLAEVFRAGIAAVSDRQMMAARALGMTDGKAMRRIIIPQVVRLMLPAIANELVLLAKNSSLLSTIAIVELTMAGKLLAEQSGAVYEVFAAVAALYVILTVGMGLALRRAEWKLRLEH